MGPPHRMPRGNHQLLRKRHHLLRNSHHMMGYSSASAELPTLLSTFKSKLSSWFASGLSESLQLKVCTCLLCTLCLAATTSACSASWNASFSLLTTVATAGCGSSLPSTAFFQKARSTSRRGRAPASAGTRPCCSSGPC